MTLAHFREWSKGLILDSGEPWKLEPFQEKFLADVFAGYPEVWLVVPEGCGKTTLLAGIALYKCQHMPRASIPVAAAIREQAEDIYRQAEIFVTESPSLRDAFRPYDGYRRIYCHETKGRIQIRAGDDRTGDGVIPSDCILDELGNHRNMKLYRVWRGKLVKRPGAQLMAISTAGEPGTEFEEARDRILREAKNVTRKGAHIRAEGKGLVLHDWAVRDREKVDDLKEVAKANPLRSITVPVLREKHDSQTMSPSHWMRRVCNIATREEGQAVTPEVWDPLAELDLEPDLAAWCIGWLDLGWEIDCSAMGVLVWESSERRVVAGVRIIPPKVDEADVVEGLLDLQEAFGPEGFVYDPNAGGRQMAQQLMKGEHPLQVQRGIGPLEFFEHSQDNAPMGLAAVRLDEALRNGWLVHDGHPGLRSPRWSRWWRSDPDEHRAKMQKLPLA